VSEDDLAMEARDPSVSDRLVPAPRARRTLAGLIDASTFGLLFALYVRWKWRSGREPGPDHNPAGLERWLRLLNPVLGVVSEQLGTPGAWIVGLRTVDPRTGRRVALWRTLAVVLLGVLTEAGRRRLTPPVPPISESERGEFGREMRAIREGYADDGKLQREAMSRFYEQHRVDVNPLRWLPAIAGAALINNRLRRHLAPTVVVVSRPRERHNP
jgi:hypothetical protein